MRWVLSLGVLALTLGACGKDEQELGTSPSEEQEAQPAADHLEDARQALDAGDRAGFLQAIDTQLSDMEQWSQSLEQDIATGYGASPDVQRAFEAFQQDLAAIRQQHRALVERPGLPVEAAEYLYERTEQLRIGSQRIRTARRQQRGGS